jgi:DNA-binding protein H-NS
MQFASSSDSNRDDLMTHKLNFDSMSLDELWLLHEEIGRVLSVRLTTEKRELEKRLAHLRREDDARHADLKPSSGLVRSRRKYPEVLPKYRNPNSPTETWSGRGKQPRWLVAALKTGRHIEEFAIAQSGAAKRKAGERRQKGHTSRV